MRACALFTTQPGDALHVLAYHFLQMRAMHLHFYRPSAKRPIIYMYIYMIIVYMHDGAENIELLNILSFA